jgi:hydroxymethylpyrimidine/phosphomethylpyrimidine kinase
VLTAQPEKGGVSMFPVQADALAAQIDGCLADGPVQAIKLGMLAQGELVQTIMERLLRLPATPTVIDPVLATNNGEPLWISGSRRAAYRELCRLRPVLTPNLLELATLTGQLPAVDEAQEIRQAEQLLAWGPTAVLIKGGHRDGAVDDFLVTAEGEEYRFEGQRMKTNARGKGCRLASALATFLGQGLPLRDAVERARGVVRVHLTAFSGK